jgi:hypothetical protein
MTAYSPSISRTFGLRDEASDWASDTASHVDEAVRESLNHYLKERLEVLLPEILSLIKESKRNSIPIDRDTILAAMEFAYSLPRLGPLPDVSLDPDGEVSFDWFGPSGQMFSVSVNKRHCLAYAGWFGENSRVHGTEKLAQGCPEQIIWGIQKATR